jgi:hypothetical protein
VASAPADVQPDRRRRYARFTGKPLPSWGECRHRRKPHIGAIVICTCGARRPYELPVATPRET